MKLFSFLSECVTDRRVDRIAIVHNTLALRISQQKCTEWFSAKNFDQNKIL